MEQIYTETIEWSGKKIKREFYKVNDFNSIPKDEAFQSQAVCFVNENEIVIFEDPDGHRGMPGGHIEPRENFGETLVREVYEESASKVIEFGPTCLIREWEENTPQKIRYGLRFWAEVELLDEPVNDPCHRGRKRMIVKFGEASKKLGWGKSADVLLNLAKDKYLAPKF